MDLQKDLSQFLSGLNSNNVEYLIVGAYAVAFYGVPRFTGDLDIFASSSRENAARLAAALRDFSRGGITLNPEDFTMPNRMFRFGSPPLRIDVMNAITGVEFDGAFERRVEGSIGGTVANFISVQDLIANKMSTGRPKDLVDVDYLKGS